MLLTSNFSDFLAKTMLIERLIGIFCYFLVVFIGFIALQNAKNQKNVRNILLLILGALCLMAFFFLPDESKDLFRIWEIALEYAQMDFKTFFKNNVLVDSSPMSELIVYIFGKIGVRGLLSLFACLIYYSCLFSLLFKAKKKLNTDSTVIAEMFLILMCSGAFLEVISDVRSFTAIVIVSTCFVSEISFNESMVKHLPFYIFAALLHLTAIPLIGLRMFSFLFFEKSEKIRLKIIIVAAFTLIFCVLGYKFIYSTFLKVISYLTNEKYKYFWEYLIGGIQLVSYIFFAIHIFKKIGIKTPLAKLTLTSLICLVIALIEYNIFHRYMIFMSIVFTMFYCMSIGEMKEKRIKVNRKNMVYICSAILLIAMARGNLCGYKFFLIG